MRPTPAYLYEKFDHYNRLCYAGELPQAEIRLNSRKKSLGLTRMTVNRLTGRRKVWIEISTRLDLPEEEYINTLLHEMIHYYVFVNGLKDSSPHGRIFRREMERLRNITGCEISVSYNPPEENRLKTRTAPRPVCLVRLNDGSAGLMFAPRTRLFEMWNMPEEFPGVRSYSWFITDNGVFDIFPTPRQPKLFKVGLEKAVSWLRDGRRLVKEAGVIKIASSGAGPEGLRQ